MTPVNPETGDTQTTESLTSRRRFISGAVGAGAGALLIGAGAWSAGIVLGQGDDDDNGNRGPGSGEDDHDEDHDSSGPGSGDDDRHDDDNSGPGSGDDDHGGHDDNDDQDEDDVVITDEVPPRSAVVHIVDDDPNGFSPSNLIVDVGQPVTFVNAHDDAHTATGGSFDTGIIQPGRIATVEFDEPGTFPYACEIHPEMTGTVEVRNNGAATPETGTPESATPAGEAGDATVTIRNLAFEPAETRIAAGSTVTWTNEDQLPHTATAIDGTFDTGTLDQGAFDSFTFDEAGTYDYECSLHPNNMKGVVIVE
jgi:plastocyanin